MDRGNLRDVSRKRRVIGFVIRIPKRLLWNRVTKFILRFILWLPIKIMRFAGYQTIAITDFLKS